MTDARAYYNEFDVKTAAWLRELIRAGVVAPGDVDDRSIVDVQPADLVGYTQCHFFAGIGVWSYALRLAGWPDDRPVWTGSCPCQPFSSAGKGEAFDDPRHLWPAWFRLIRQCRPVRIFGEQVESAVLRGWLDVVSADVEAEGYTVGSALLGAHSVGAPHIRQRVYFVADTDSGRVGEHARELPGHEGQHEVGRADGDHASLDRRAAHVVADTDGDGRDQTGRGESTPGDDGAVGDCGTGGVADSTLERRARDEGNRREAERRPELSGIVVDATSGGRRVGGDASLEGSGGHADRAGIAGELGFAEREGLEGHGGDVDDRDQSGRFRADETRPVAETGAFGRVAESTHTGRSAGDGGNVGREERREEGRESEARFPSQAAEHRGADGGFWADAEWIACTDGKARPVEPGTFPLAHGAPFRVVRLRGYGNAIVAQAAEAFIRAYVDVRGG